MEWLPAFPGWDLPCGPGRFPGAPPGDHPCCLYLDNDLAGRVNARKIKALLKSDQRFSKIRVSVNPPRSGKDYNEKLQRTLQAIREEKHASRQKQAAVSI